ncbi:MAG: aldehyde dehydrogenase family protein [Candidatus Puniceispirillaceae bacterium]
MTTTTSLFIDGTPCEAEGGALYDIYNPARPSEKVGQAASASIADVDNAIAAAEAAFPHWSQRSVQERAQYLLQVADSLNQDESEVGARSRLFTTEHGKTLFETTIEINRLVDRFRQVAGFADRLAEEQRITGAMFETIVTRQSRGVTTLIVPWNWPLAILGSKLPQALLAGNTVIIKLSEQATLAPAQTICKIAAMLPKGVVNLITGDGTVIGDRLVGHPLVRQVNFTGSIPVGRHVMQTAAQNLTPVTLELGGNDPGILLDDVSLTPEFFKKVMLSAFLTSGQICMALKRLYVPRSLFDDVIDGLSEILSKQRIGDGLKEGVTLGPLNNQKQQKIVQTMLDEAHGQGQSIRYLGEIDDEADFAAGYFLQPSLIIDADPALSVVRDEQFGPTLPVLAYDTIDEAIQMANDSRYGLSSSVWSEDSDRAFDIARHLEAGFTNINGHGPTAMDGLSPFGGVKQSGIGRNFGLEGILQFQEYHSISAPKDAAG